MTNKPTIEQVAEKEWRFNRALNQARAKIDSSTQSGKKLDQVLTPVYKQFGYWDHIAKSIELDVGVVPMKAIKFFDDTVDNLLDKLGLDIAGYSAFQNDQKRDFDTSYKLTNSYMRARSALENVRKKFIYQAYATGNSAWDIFGILHWVTDFENVLDQALNTHKQVSSAAQNQIAESLKRLIYLNPTPETIENQIANVCSKYNVSKQTVRYCFENQTASTIEYYSKVMLNEGLMSKVAGVFVDKDVKRGRDELAKDVAIILADWKGITQNQQNLATRDALKNFLVNNFNVDSRVISSSLKKFSNEFIGNQAKPKEQYLPKKSLSKFFSDVELGMRQLSLKPVTTKSSPKAASATNSHQAASQPLVNNKNPKNTVASVEQLVQSMPPNERSKAILAALPHLDNQQIKDILTQLVTKKP